MGSFSIYHWIILGVVVLVLFGGGGKISSLMGDFAKGIKSFKKTMSEDETSQQDLKAQKAPIAPPQNTAQAKEVASKESHGDKDASMAEEVSSQSPR